VNLHISAVLAISLRQLVCVTESSSDLYHQTDFGSREIREQIMFFPDMLRPVEQRKALLATPSPKGHVVVAKRTELIPGEY